MSVTFKSNADQVVKSINSKSMKLGKTARGLMRRVATDWEREMVIGQFSGYYPGLTSGRKLRNRSGALRSSVKASVVGGSTLGSVGVQFTAGSAAAGYATIQEYGGVVRPKKRKYLRVPLPAAMTSSGVVRAGVKPIRSGSGWRTADGNPTFVRAKNGRAVVYQKKGSAVEPLFVLKGSVKIKGRLGMRKTMRKVLKRHAPKIAEALAHSLRRTV